MTTKKRICTSDNIFVVVRDRHADFSILVKAQERRNLIYCQNDVNTYTRKQLNMVLYIFSIKFPFDPYAYHSTRMSVCVQ